MLRAMRVLLSIFAMCVCGVAAAATATKLPPITASAASGTCLSAAVCNGGTLCQPLSPQPTFTNEVVAYHSDGAYGSNGSGYKQYDWCVLHPGGTPILKV